jgi:hypothetical protein
MLLPPQHCTAEHDAVLFDGRFQRLEIAARTQISERGSILPRGIAGGIEGKMQNTPRRLEWRKRPRVHFSSIAARNGCGVSRVPLPLPIDTSALIASPSHMMQFLTSVPKFRAFAQD